MGVLDSVMNETGSELGISTNSSRSVMSGLLSFINQEDGGFGGFLDRFRRAGSGNVVSSWLSGEARPVSTDTVENALGHSTIERIGSRAGLSFSTCASAIALMIPKLTRQLAPGGAIPKTLSPDVRSYISAPAAAVSTGVSHAASTVDTVTRSRGASRFLWPLLLLLAGILLVMWLVNRAPAVNVNAPTTASRTAFNAEEQVGRANQQASAALASLKPGFTARELTTALNKQAINFAPGSATIPASSQDTLSKSAAAIQQAPAGTVIEISGHTDNTGDASSNMQLSRQRAEAVQAYLVQQGVNPAMLTATGYGDTRATASNDTDAGRFQNRRIEFTAR
jgi:outer membrane protein OmpA-like peptidoglycan-associated protein/uncharacterized protein YidB (DUF937 family)